MKEFIEAYLYLFKLISYPNIETSQCDVYEHKIMFRKEMLKISTV